MEQRAEMKKHPIPAELETLFESSARRREALFERHIRGRALANPATVAGPTSVEAEEELELVRLATTLEKARATLRRFRPANDGDTMPSVPAYTPAKRQARPRAQASSRLRVA